MTRNRQQFPIPGSTASGIASGRQLVELTTATGLSLDMTAAPRPLVIYVPLQGAPVDVTLALENAADELDRDIARKRLAEINENPALLIKGEQLHERLAMIKP
jgi:hypothetical protein